MRFYTEEQWASFSLQKQLIIVFLSCVLISLIGAEVVALVFLIGFSQNLSSLSSSALKGQLSTNLANGVVSNAALVIEAELSRAVDSALLVVAASAADGFRSDYSTSTETSYWEGIGLADTVVVSGNSTRYRGQTVSLQHSTWLVPDTLSGANPPAPVSSDVAAARDATAHSDSFSRSIYTYNPSILSIFSAHDATGLFRHFPGTSNSYSNGLYDPRKEGWYTDAIRYASSATSSNPSLRVFSAPRYDTIKKDWVITASTGMVDPVTQGSIGVAGVDCLINEFNLPLKTLATTSQGSVGIFYLDQTGNAIAHSNWDTTSTTGYSVKNAFNSDVWNAIRSSTGNNYSVATTSFGSYEFASSIAIWKFLEATDGKQAFPTWVSVGIFPKSTIDDRISSLQSSTRTSLIVAVAISIAVFVAITVIVVGLVVGIARGAVKPLTKLSNESTTIANNIGTGDLFRGVGRQNSVSSSVDAGIRRRIARVDETEALTSRFYAMVQAIRDGAAGTGQPGAQADSTNRGDEVTQGNAFFGNRTMPAWDAAGHNPEVLELLPDAPPSYEVLTRGPRSPIVVRDEEPSSPAVQGPSLPPGM